ncbi:MAG TPA: hypothetical protein VFE51_07915 [Verrucomicrobiae bacterium]|nr:hypothetical protein [Verrucomicrobiae bacterium]
MRTPLIFLLLASRLQAIEPAPATGPARTFVIGVSPFLERTVKDDVYRGLVRLLVQDLPLNSTVTLYDAYHLQTITSVSIPGAAPFESPKTRANQFASSIRQLKQFLAGDPAKPAVPRLKFEAALLLPQFYDFLSATVSDTNRPMTVLLIGSPLYQDSKEPDFSMVDGYFPSDGHLQAPRDKSVFGLSGPPVRALQVHWLYFSDPWQNDLYKEKVTRFWALYLQARSARLVTFCNDAATAFRSFSQTAETGLGLARNWSIDPQQTKIEMLRIGREVELADWIQGDSVLHPAQRPPSILFGPMKIGIRWKDNIDLDLYATPHAGAETLFFQHPRSPEGFYYKDHRSSPGREFEFVEFETPVDARQVEAFVNFYKGDCPRGPRGEVRVEFDGRIYSAPFSISASEGNRGRLGQGQEQYWQRIPLQEMLRISRAE